MDFLDEEQGFLADKFQDWGDDPRPETWAAIQKQLRRRRLRLLLYRGGYLASILALLLLSWFAFRQYQGAHQPQLAQQPGLARQAPSSAQDAPRQAEAQRPSQAAGQSLPAAAGDQSQAAQPGPQSQSSAAQAPAAVNEPDPPAQSGAQAIEPAESQSNAGHQPNRVGHQPNTSTQSQPIAEQPDYVAAETTTRPARTTRRRRNDVGSSQSPAGQRQRDDRGAIAPGRSATSQSPAATTAPTTGLNGGISLNAIRKPRNRRLRSNAQASSDAYGTRTAPATIAANTTPARSRRTKGNNRQGHINNPGTSQAAPAAIEADQATGSTQNPTTAPTTADGGNINQHPAQSSQQPQNPGSQAQTPEVPTPEAQAAAQAAAKADSLAKAQAAAPAPAAPAQSPWQWSLGLRYGPMGRLIQVDRSAYPGPMKVQRLGADLQSRYAIELAAALERRLTNAFSLQGQLGIGYFHDVLIYAQSQESAVAFDVTPLKDGSGYQLNRQWVPEPQLVNYKLGLLTLNTSLYLQAMLPNAPVGLRLGGGITVKALQTQRRLGQSTQTSTLDGVVPYLQSELFLRRRPTSRLEGTLFIRQYLNSLSQPEQAIRVRPWQAGIGLVWRF